MPDPVAPAVEAPVAVPAALALAPAPVSVTPAPAAAPMAAVPAPAVAPTVPAAVPAEAVPTPAPAAPVIPAVAPAEPTSLLSDAVSKPPVADPADPAEPTPPVIAPTYEPFKTPEGVKLGDGEVAKFTELLGKFETDSKADHAKMQALGQQMVDFYLAEQKRASDAMMESFNKMRDGWRQNVTADPDLGGNRLQTTMSQAGAFIEQFGGTAEQQAELRQVLRITGAGDHPAMVRAFRNAGLKLATEPGPVVPQIQKNPLAGTKSQRRYPSLNANGTGAS